jgi:CxxC motif-containing protein (DUF1111 family)
MKSTWPAVAFVCLSLVLGACSTSPSTGPAATSSPIPAPVQAPVGFDNGSNGLTDNPTHQFDQSRFEQTESIAEGLGPLYNAQSCRECHQSPATGGVSQVAELRVGHKGPDGRFQSPLIPINGGTAVIKGRTLVNARTICPSAAFPNVDIQERVPDSENIRATRISLSVLGAGFVEALEDATLLNLSSKQCRLSGGKICGQALAVPVLESPGITRIGRFGWKDQQASLVSFSADAYLNEIGITNALLPAEVTDLCNSAAEPNDRPGPDGLTDIEHFARFMRATKAPPRDARQAATAAAKKGEALFSDIGCATCHVPTLQTAPTGTVVNGGTFVVPAPLGNKEFHPYSDFLLHDVGTGDGIVVAMAEHYGPHVYDVGWRNLSPDAYSSTANKIRTAALWGVRTHSTLMHDGASLSFQDAIIRHHGEASEVTRRFQRLTREDQESILEFLKCL